MSAGFSGMKEAANSDDLLFICYEGQFCRKLAVAMYLKSWKNSFATLIWSNITAKKINALA